MPPKRKDEELDLDVHPSLEKEYLDRIERAKQTCVGSVNGKQREAFIVRGIDKDITDKSRAIREKEKLAEKAARKAKRQKTERAAAGGAAGGGQGGAGAGVEVAVRRAAAADLQ